jgi:tRNA/rRNA methyltransferase
VLVRPSLAANIGAAARVMRNFGVKDLYLVSPHADPLGEEAKKLSTHGESLLHSARSVDELGAAIADCVMAVATSARLGGLFRHQNLGTPVAIMPKAVDALADGPVALVFGPEATGLTNDEVSRCHYLLTIPADEGYPVLNLAQAVAVCLYEFYQTSARGSEHATAKEEVAPMADQERLFVQLEEGLRDIHFLWDERAPTQMHAIRHLLGRAKLSPMEVRVLMGMARQLRWYVRHHPPASDAATAPPFDPEARGDDPNHDYCQP